ncbi:hypothetical protein ACFVZN_18005, partial [Streptomyces virginiae]
MIERATPIETSPAPPDFEDLLRTVAEMGTPDGFKAELIRGKIVVSPFSRLRYSRRMRLLREQLQAHVPEGHFADTSPFLFRFPDAKRGYGPDLYVADEAAFEEDGLHADGAGATRGGGGGPRGRASARLCSSGGGGRAGGRARREDLRQERRV